MIKLLQKQRLLYIANVAWFFRSHRLPIALEAVKRGYEVHLASAFKDRQEQSSFEQLGISTHSIPFERSGTAFLSEFTAMRRLRQLLTKLRPALCHNVSIKPVLYAGALCRLHGIPAVNAISGLGYSYIAQGLKAELRRFALNSAYSVALNGKRSRVIVQNSDDQEFFKTQIRVADSSLVMIRGAGVDLAAFAPRQSLADSGLVVLPARMLVDKGVREFAAAAKILRDKGVHGRFVLVGGLDPENRAGLSQQELDSLTTTGAVEYWGHRTDIPEIFNAAQIVCLPTYREGLPKALLEAASAGAAIVATDVPGCREVVEQENNGLLVPPRDPVALAAALERLLIDPRLCTEMGRRGREMAEQHFSVEMVVSRTFQLYEELVQ